MIKHAVLLSLLVPYFSTLAYGQEARPTKTTDPANEKILIVAAETKSDSIVAVPPITSVAVSLKAENKPSTDAIDLPNWIAKEVEIVVGKDGRVISAHAISGPTEGYKACENAVRKWVFKPYLVLDKPAEVEQKVLCSNN